VVALQRRLVQRAMLPTTLWMGDWLCYMAIHLNVPAMRYVAYYRLAYLMFRLRKFLVLDCTSGGKVMFPRGEHPPLTKNLLPWVKKQLVKKRGCRIQRDFRDESNRICGFEAVTLEGTHFFCVARNTEPMKRGPFLIVSTQTRVVRTARREEKPLVMYWPDQFYVFDAETVLGDNFGENVRADLKGVNIRFLNFSATLGVAWRDGSRLIFAATSSLFKKELKAEIKI